MKKVITITSNLLGLTCPTEIKVTVEDGQASTILNRTSKLKDSRGIKSSLKLVIVRGEDPLVVGDDFSLSLEEYKGKIKGNTSFGIKSSSSSASVVDEILRRNLEKSLIETMEELI
jgi:hypothetical protein